MAAWKLRFIAQRLQEVVYYFQPESDCTATISLCATRNTSEPFDTLLFVLEGLSTSSVTSKACNDDYCGQQSQLTVDPQSCRSRPNARWLRLGFNV